jgi:L-lactate dehydrogenase
MRAHPAPVAQRRVAIIGTGWVGTSVAISTLHAGVADELLLTDARADVAEGEAMDLAQGAAFYPSATVRTASVEEMVDADVVVVAAGRGGKPGQSRLELLQGNASLIADLGRRLAGCRGTVLMVSNPVDVLTRVMQQASGLPPERVLGTGTALDTARLRQMLGSELGVDPRSVHAQVVGEHGDSEVVLWSQASVGSLPLRDWPGWTAEKEARIAHDVRRAAYEIIARKGVTNHAIGLVTADILQALLRDERRVLTVSRVHAGSVHGAGGSSLALDGVALSLPALVGHGGATDVLLPGLEPAEQAALEHSAQVLRDAAATL